MLGLPFAFAGQFAPVLLGEALDLYRTRFQPSSYLDRPYIMVGLPVIAADTDAQAQYLATSSFQRVLRLRRGQPIFVPPPVESMDGLWNELEQQMVREHFGVAVIGGPETVRQKLRSFAESTQADELMLHSEFYRHEDRLRSYEIVASLGL